MSKELVFVPKQETPLALIQDAGGDAIMMINDAAVPVVDSLIDMFLIQPGHVKKNKELAPNMFKFAYKDKGLDDLFSEEIVVLPIAVIGRGRRLYPAFDSGDSALLCYSNNNLVPAKRVAAPISLACGCMEEKDGKDVFVPSCPKAVWDDGKKPDCSDVVSVALFDLGLKAPIRFQFSGTSISAWNQFLRDNSKAKNIARLRNKPLKDYVAVMRVSNEGTYGKITFTYEERPELNAAAYKPLLSWYLDNLVSSKWAKDAAESDEEIKVSGPVEVLPEDPIMDAKEAEAKAPAGKKFSV